MRRILTAAICLAPAIAIPTASPGARLERPVHEVKIVAKKFAFEPSTIQVVEGEPVRLVIHSADVTHGFAIRKLKLDVRITKGGDALVAEFAAPPAGRYDISCSEFCGGGHGRMKGTLVSVKAATSGP